jgi:type II secretory pathway pseudopilin PulG
MNHLTRQELQQLAPALTLATSILIVAAGLLVISSGRASEAESRQQSAMKQLRQAQQALTEENAEREEIAARLPGLQELAPLRESSQLDPVLWQEELESARQKIGIQTAVMQFSPPETSPGEPATPHLQQRRLDLQLGLLHESEFLQMMDFLRAYPRALAIPRQCRLARAQNRQTDGLITLQATCTVDWFSYREMPAGRLP